jgi:hypothetical protein
MVMRLFSPVNKKGTMVKPMAARNKEADGDCRSNKKEGALRLDTI